MRARLFGAGAAGGRMGGLVALAVLIGGRLCIGRPGLVVAARCFPVFVAGGLRRRRGLPGLGLGSCVLLRILGAGGKARQGDERDQSGGG
jgi:hypothetical protein